MRSRCWTVGLALGLGAFGGTIRGELPKATVKPKPVCAIPNYSYSVTGTTPHATVTAVSLPRVPANQLATAATPAPTVLTADAPPAGVPLTIPATPGVPTLPAPAPLAARPAKPPYVYQFKETKLQIDHCYLSRMAVALHENGEYQISFRADQNPTPSDDKASPVHPGDPVPTTTLQTSQILRNQFVVKVRGYANFQGAVGAATTTAGKPVLVEFPVETFWVQRGQPYSGFVNANSAAVRKNFVYIDRIEIEFTYR